MYDVLFLRIEIRVFMYVGTCVKHMRKFTVITVIMDTVTVIVCLFLFLQGSFLYVLRIQF